MDYLNWISDHETFIFSVLVLVCLTYAVPAIVASLSRAISEMNSADDE
jgi:hypothetical protein